MTRAGGGAAGLHPEVHDLLSVKQHRLGHGGAGIDSHSEQFCLPPVGALTARYLQSFGIAVLIAWFTHWQRSAEALCNRDSTISLHEWQIAISGDKAVLSVFSIQIMYTKLYYDMPEAHGDKRGSETPMAGRAKKRAPHRGAPLCNLIFPPASHSRCSDRPAFPGR